MRKIILGISVLSLVILAFGFYLTSARADDKPNQGRDNEDNHNSGNFNPDKQLSKSACGEDLKDPIINVTQKVQNDVDSGIGGYWAFDYYTRHIKVWKTPSEADNTYCGIVVYGGKFYAVPGQVGPGDSAALINTSTNAPVNGDMSGGYRATITGNLLSSPTWSTNGNVGTTNYQCNIGAVCPGRISWLDQYFSPSYGFAYSWWGWKYNGGSHGTWINSQDGNSGNIL